MGITEAVQARIQTLLAHTPRRFTLENGLVVLHLEDHSTPLVNLQCWVQTGSLHEGAWLGAGLSHYLEHLLFKGTQRRGVGQIAREVQSSGGSINAYTTFDRTVYHLEMPEEAAGQGLDLLHDMVAHAALPPAEVEREKGVILREIDMGLDDPDRCLTRFIFETAFRRHPYRHPVIGHRDAFERLGQADVEAYYRGRYQPHNAVLVVVGALEPGALDTALASTFARWERQPLSPSLYPGEPAQLQERSGLRHGDYRIGRGALAFRIPGLTHPDAPAVDLLAAALGQGQSSRLWQALREDQRLVHHIDASAWAPGELGLFFISFLCNSEQHEAAQEAIQSVLAALAEDPPQGEELAKLQRQALLQEVRSRKTFSGQAGRWGMMEVVVGDLGYGQRYLQRLAAVDAEQLARVAAEVFVPERQSRVALLPQVPQAAPVDVRVQRTAPPPAFVETRFENGARLLVQEDRRLPLVHLRCVIRGGPLYESPGQRGVTSLLATLLTRDTASRSAAEVAGLIERLGARFDDFVGNNTWGLSLECLPDDLPVALEVLEEALHAPAFADSTLAREREALVARLDEDLDDVVEYSRKALRRHFFGPHPFAVDADGERADLLGLDAAALRAHLGRLLRGPEVVLAVSGDIDPAELHARTSGWLGQLPEGLETRPPVPWPARDTAERVVEHQPREQAVVWLAFPDAGICDEAYVAGEVLDELANDMGGQLFHRLREANNLAYFCGAGRVLGLDGGMFAFLAGTHPQSAEAALGELRREAQRLAAGVSQAELDAARARLRTHRRQLAQKASSRAMQAALNALYGQPIDDLPAYEARLQSLTLEAVQQFAQARLDPGSGLELVVCPAQ